MHEQFQPISDVITLLANQQHGEASVLFNDLLGARVSDALQSHKQDIAKSLFAPSADNLAEGTEQIDELSKSTLKSYAKQATGSLSRTAHEGGFNTARMIAQDHPIIAKKSSIFHFDPKADQDVARKRRNRNLGINTAIDKLTKEESEQLDELSKATLGNYVKKASHQAADKAYEVGYQGGKKSSTGMGDVSGEIRRHRGIRRAVDKLVR